MNYYLILFIITAASLYFLIMKFFIKRRIEVQDGKIAVYKMKTEDSLQIDDIVKVSTEIYKSYYKTIIYYKKNDDIYEGSFLSSEKGYWELIAYIREKLGDKLDIVTHLMAENNNFAKAIRIVKDEYQRNTEEFTDDDIHEERLFEKVVKYISKPEFKDVKNIKYIINTMIENPKDILLLDDITGVFTTNLYNLGYDVTSLQYTDAAKSHVAEVAEGERAQPDIYTVKYDDIDYIREHDMAVLLYPTHVYYDRVGLLRLLKGIYKNLKNNGGLLINNRFQPNLETQYFAYDNGILLNESVTGVISNEKVGKRIIYKYIEVGLDSLKISKRHSVKWIWDAKEIMEIAAECGFRYIETFSNNNLIMFAK